MLYQNIKQLRKNKGLSLIQIADQLSMHKTTYTRYETGEREIPLNIAILLAEYYNVSLDYIAGLSNDRDKK